MGDDGEETQPQLFAPTPRRPLPAPLTTITAADDNTSSPQREPAPASAEFQPSNPQTPSSNSMFGEASSPPQKSRSILNLTSSTLFGIYAPNGYDPNGTSPATPWGTGAQTPMRSGSLDLARASTSITEEELRRKTSQNLQNADKRRRRGSDGLYGHHRRLSWTRYTLMLTSRIFALFALGVAYGAMVTHLHDTERLAPVQVEGIDRNSWHYLLFWGTTGVALGHLLPWVDGKWGNTHREHSEDREEASRTDDKRGNGNEPRRENRGISRSSLGADWNPIVRSIGAFVGIAFAIRKLPWQSTLQVSLTLTLVNPVIWYLIDRSRTGFALSLAVGVAGAVALLGINPDIVPAPATSTMRSSSTSTLLGMALNRSTSSSTSEPELLAGLVSYESIGVAAWISSVLFCSSVCFGNIGRRLVAAGEG